MDLGTVLIGSNVTRSVKCTNAGTYLEENGAEAPLWIDSIASDSEVFEVGILNLDGTREPKDEGYFSGESFQVEVVFSPVEDGFVSGTITLGTAAAPGGSLAIEVIGRGQVAGVCTQEDEFTWSSPENELPAAFPRRFILRALPLDRTGDGVVDAEDIELTLDGVATDPMDDGKVVWIYDADANMIDFRPLYVPKSGVVGRATYDYACPE